VRTIVRCCLSAVLIVTLSDLSLAAGTSEKPLGVIVLAQHAHFAGANAMVGTNVYAGDNFGTDDSGTLGLRLGTGRIVLLAGSAASINRESEVVRMGLTRGTAVFSSPAPAKFDLETPAGTLHSAQGQAISGRVEVRGPAELVIVASSGDLTLDNVGELHLIRSGTAVRVVIEDAGADAAADQGTGGSTPHARRRRKKLALYIIVLGAAGGISAAIFNDHSESTYKP
jgi:hypothetical protein